MNKVWVLLVIDFDNGSEEVWGVFANKEKATKRATELNHHSELDLLCTVHEKEIEQ